MTTPTPRPRRGPGLMIALFVFVSVTPALYFFLKRDTAGGKGGAGGRGGPDAKGDRKVPVVVEAVAQRDVPLVIEGLGTVTPLASVQLRAQVDGRLMSVNFKEGANVKRGELLAQLDPRAPQIAVAQTAATLAKDQATLRNATLLLERNKDLRKQNLVSQQVVDDQQTLVDQLQAQLAIDQAANDNAKLQLDYTRVVSPIDGVAGIRQVDPGNMVRGSDPAGLVVITQLDPISVIFTLPQDQLEQLQRAMTTGPLHVEARARDGHTLLAEGTLAVIDNQMNATTGTMRLRAVFPNEKRALWPNQFVKARLTIDQRKDAVVVPAAAIQRGPDGTFVYVAAADDTAQLRPVEVDVIEATYALIRSGLTVGEKVIIDGQSQLKPGAGIEVRTPTARGKGAR